MQAEVVNFWNNLEKIQNMLLLSDEKFAQYLGINQNLLLTKKKQLSYLPLNCVFELAEKLNFHFEDLLKDNFTLNCILKEGNYSPILPQKYSIAPYSSTRPILNVLSYLHQKKGDRAKINLLRKLQTTESTLNTPDQKTNILLLTDAVKHLILTHQLKSNDLITIGQNTPMNNHDFSEGLSNKKNIYDVVDYFMNECAHKFDKNYIYQIEKMRTDHVIIQATPSKDALDELGLKISNFGSEEVCLTRMGVFSSIPFFKYKKYAHVRKISSIYAGDKTHRYEMDLSQFNKLRSFPDFSAMNTSTIYH